MFGKEADSQRRFAEWSSVAAALTGGFLAAWLSSRWMPAERLDAAAAFSRSAAIIGVSFLASLVLARLA